MHACNHRNATALQPAEEALRERQALLDEVQRVARIGHWDYDIRADRLQWSAEIYRIFELPPDTPELTYACVLARMHQDDRERVNREFLASLDGAEVADIVHRVPFPDGRVKYVNQRWAIHRDAQGTPLRALGTAQDITARRLAELAAEARERELHTLLAERRRVEEERDAAARALGRYAAELKDFSDLMAAYRPPHEQIRSLLDFGCRTLGAESAALGEIQAGRYRLLTAFGDRPAPLGPGETVGLARAELDALAALAAPAAQGTDWSGVAADAPSGPELPPGSGLLVATLLQWSDADGTTHAGALSFAPGPGDGERAADRRQIVQLVGQRIAASLRERAVLEGLLAARQKEVVGHLASGVAHDFNNLIGVVDLNLDYLRELLPATGLDPEVLEILEETRLATRHAQVVTAGMLSLSRRQGTPPRAADLSGAVERFIHGLGRILPADIAIATRIDPQVSALADPALLQSALLNLIINARDAMAGEGRLDIALARVRIPSARTLTLGALDAGEYAELSVADSGSGMPPEVRARIFEPLVSPKAQGRGTGLGLFMVRELALRWGGGVDVESSPGQGSRFRLYLPATAVADDELEGQQDQAPLSLPVGSPGRVLVVDDDSSMRLILGHLLEHHGYRVDEAGDGVQALAMLAAGTPCDLVLSDIVMPNMDGIELHRRLARTYPDLPVILMTADEHQSVEAAGLPVGTQILFKPLVHRLLLTRIQARLPGGR